MWKVTEHKRGSQILEFKVTSMVKEMAAYTYLTYAESFIYRFHENLKDIPKSNNFSADHMYRAKEVDTNSVEVWKMNVKGDFKYKMFTLVYQPPCSSMGPQYHPPH
jgi:hypothetical protein